MSEIDEIPKGWTNAILEDLLDYIQPTNYIVESTEYSDKYKTPVLTAGKTFVLGKTNETNGIFQNLPVIIFDDFTTATKFVNFPFKVKSSAMKILKPTSDLVNIWYAYYFIQTIRITVDTHKRYWISNYSQLPILLPPLAEQHRIVAKIEELFSSLDKGIESLKTAQKELVIYRQSVLKWAFEGKLTNKNVVDGALPEGWKWKTFNEVCFKIGDIDHKMPQEVENGEYPYLSTKDFTNELKVSFKNAKYISKTDYINLSKKIKPEKGDIIFPRYGTIGKNIFIDFDREFLVSYSCAILKPNPEKVFGKYLYHLSLSPIIRDEIKKYTVQTTQANIGIASIKSFIIPLPILSEQNLIVAEIESRLSVCDKIEESISTSLLQAEALRQSILKKAFEGKLVPQDPNDEPASKLLERIKAERIKNQPIKKLKNNIKQKN